MDMREEESIDIKFRLYNGSDIGTFHYSSSSTVDFLKQRVVSDCPGKTVVPKGINGVKLISSGKILEQNKTVGQCKTPFREVAGGVIVMHVVVQPLLPKLKHELVLCVLLSFDDEQILMWRGRDWKSRFVNNHLTPILSQTKIADDAEVITNALNTLLKTAEGSPHSKLNTYKLLLINFYLFFSFQTKPLKKKHCLIRIR
ncbi:hypothetical protein Bca52824_011134 [Brassica carinata]|uniref:Ubiquitin-like domain-containing protein n=1 Tax=Brassica carinata TaxID=52824 RepID=A0A8X7WF81_BRACI|nr:hypothetical protein Bca52824_011134 [Brassica carinata]